MPPEDYAPLDEACRGMDVRSGWVVFSSANSVDAFMSRLREAGLDLRALKGVKVCAVGTATAARLAAAGLLVDLVPKEFRAEAVVQAIAASGNVRGAARVLVLPRSDIGREVVPEELRIASAPKSPEVVAYRTMAIVDLEQRRRTRRLQDAARAADRRRDVLEPIGRAEFREGLRR